MRINNSINIINMMNETLYYCIEYTPLMVVEYCKERGYEDSTKTSECWTEKNAKKFSYVDTAIINVTWPNATSVSYLA